MSLNDTPTDLLRDLIAAGLDPFLIARVSLMVSRSAEIDRRREKDAARQQKVRDKKLQNVTLRHATSRESQHVTLSENSIENQQLNGSNNLYIDSSLTSSSDSKEERKKEDSSVVARARGLKLAEKFTEFWSAYPKRRGSNPKHPAAQKFFDLMKSGIDPEAIIMGARNYAADPATEVGSPYVKQARFWLNQRCWEDYREPPTPETGIPPDIPPERHKDWLGGWRPGMPTREELYGKEQINALEYQQKEGSGIRKTSESVHREPTEDFKEKPERRNIPRNNSRHSGMVPLGALFSGLPGLRAAGDASGTDGTTEINDGPGRDSGMV